LIAKDRGGAALSEGAIEIVLNPGFLAFAQTMVDFIEGHFSLAVLFFMVFMVCKA